MTTMETTINDARVRQATRAMAQARKAAMLRKEREELTTQYPFLTPLTLVDDNATTDERYNAYKVNARTLTKNIKTMLKRLFPEHKFSVTRCNYSGGFHYDVDFTGVYKDFDDKRAQEMDVQHRIEAYFQRKSHYGVDDSFTSTDTPFTRVFGGCPYSIYCRMKQA